MQAKHAGQITHLFVFVSATYSKAACFGLSKSRRFEFSTTSISTFQTTHSSPAAHILDYSTLLFKVLSLRGSG